MEWQAVYVREENPENDGVPVALFRTPAIMGTWHRTAEGVVGRDMIVRTVELPEDFTWNSDVAEVLGTITATVYGPMPDEALFEQLKAEARAELVRESFRLQARRDARRELEALGYPLPPDPEAQLGLPGAIAMPYDADDDDDPESWPATDSDLEPYERALEGQSEVEGGETTTTPPADGEGQSGAPTELSEQSGGVVTEGDAAISRPPEPSGPDDGE